MSHEIKIPSVGESISSATIDTWFKADGDYVKSGEVLLSIETDKVSQELETEHDGILRHAAAEGDEVDIGAVVATIEEGEPPEDSGDSSAGESKDDQASDTEAAPAGEGAGEAPASGEKEQPAAESSTGKEIKATPVARKVAEDQGIDLATVSGTGAGGRITKADVFAAAEERDRAAKAADKAKKKGDTGGADAVSAKTSPAAAGGSGPRTTRRKMSPLRRKIADHLLNAQHQAALLTTFNECDMSAVMALRKRVQEDFIAKHGVKLGFMSFFVKAVVHALRAVPSVNARIEGDEMVENHYYDIGVAVGTEKGLIVPVLRDCDGKSFAAIEQDIIDRATAAREGKIQLADLQGGVFTITNGGIYGSMLSTPILNPPQSGILGMHNIQQRPVAVDGEVVIRPMMYLALTYDHRVVDGKEAVTFLVKVKECIENPERMMLDL